MTENPGLQTYSFINRCLTNENINNNIIVPVICCNIHKFFFDNLVIDTKHCSSYTLIFQFSSHVDDINKFDTLPESEISDDQLPYDYRSIMHPDPFTESTNLPTFRMLKPIRPRREDTLFTDLDFLHVKMVYGKGTVRFYINLLVGYKLHVLTICNATHNVLEYTEFGDMQGLKLWYNLQTYLKYL